MLRRLPLWCFTTLGITYYCQGIIAALQNARGDIARTVAGETNVYSTITQSFILVVLLILVLRDLEIYLRLGRLVLPLLCVAGLALVSVAWSDYPIRTLRRGFAFGECLVFGLFLYRTLGLDRTIERVGWIAVWLGVLSLGVFVAVPSIGHEQALGYEGAMRGVFPQKNTMTDCMLLGVCCFGYRMLREPKLRLRNPAALALLGLCLVMGKSASSILVAFLVLALALWLRLRGRPVLRAGYVFVALWAFAAIVLAFALFPDDIFALTGRDATLTGRLPLWQALMPEIRHRLLTGYGYAGFWNADSTTVQYIWLKAGWPAPDAHSGYLDVVLQLGLLGLAGFAWVWARMLRLLRQVGRLRWPAASWIALFSTALLTVSLDEGPLANPNEWTMLLPTAMAAMAYIVAQQRFRAASGRNELLASGRTRGTLPAVTGSPPQTGSRAG